MYWLMESKIVSSIAPHQTKKDFVSEDKKINSSGVSTMKEVYSKQFKSNSEPKWKYSENTEVLKKGNR